MASARLTNPYLRFHELARQTVKPKRKPGTFLKENLRRAPKAPDQIKAFSPSILPFEPPKPGNEYHEQRTFAWKQRRMWTPNYRDHALPVRIFGGDQSLRERMMLTAPMKLRIEDVDAIEKAGGLEAFLIHTRSHELSEHGKLLRHNLFQELNRMRETGLWYAGPSSKSDPWIPMKSVVEAADTTTAITAAGSSTATPRITPPKSLSRAVLDKRRLATMIEPPKLTAEIPLNGAPKPAIPSSQSACQALVAHSSSQGKISSSQEISENLQNPSQKTAAPKAAVFRKVFGLTSAEKRMAERALQAKRSNSEGLEPPPAATHQSPQASV